MDYLQNPSRVEEIEEINTQFGVHGITAASFNEYGPRLYSIRSSWVKKWDNLDLSNTK